MVTQFDTLDSRLPAPENLRACMARYFGLPRATLDERIPQLLEFAALTHKAAGKPGEAVRRHGGACRWRALVNAPRLLLLDEPTTGLGPAGTPPDVGAAAAPGASGTSILLTTHFMDEAERLCSRLPALDHGRKIAGRAPR